MYKHEDAFFTAYYLHMKFHYMAESFVSKYLTVSSESVIG